jgi:hypothetical protein
VLRARAPVSLCRWWEAQHEYYLCALGLTARDPRKGYVMKGQEVLWCVVCVCVCVCVCARALARARACEIESEPHGNVDVDV